MLWWLAPIVGGRVDGYVLDAGFSPGTTAVSAPLGATTSVTIPGVGAGTYYLRLRAVGPAGSGPPSSEQAVTVGPCPSLTVPFPLTAHLNGSRLTLLWVDGTGCAGRALRLLAGSQSGAADLAVLPISTSPLEAAVPPGQFFLRVAAETNATSNEVRVVATGTCPPPAFPIGLSGRVAGGVIDLQWYPTPAFAATALDAATPLAYVLEAGRSHGSTDLGTIPLGRTASFVAGAPSGRYHVRVRAANVCGLGPASNDVVLAVP
jgi:hypothetical protein